MVAEYSRHVAEGLESMAQSLSRGSLDDQVGGVEDFARERPVAFMGGAMMAGFALARFMKGSAGRRSERGARDETRYASAGFPAAASTAGAAMPASTARPASPGPAGMSKEAPDATH